MKNRIISLIALIAVLLLSACNPNDPSDDQRDSFIKFFGSYMSDIGKDVVVNGGDGYALTGVVTTLDSLRHMVLIITSVYGNATETVYFGGEQESAGNAIDYLGDGFILAGSIDSTVNNEVRKYAYIVRTGPDGSLTWEHAFASDEDAAILDVISLSGGGYLAAGYKYRNGQKDWWIFRTDENGVLLYQQTGMLEDSDDEAVSVLETPHGYLVACTYDDGLYDLLDIELIYVNSSCIPLDSKAFGTDDNDYAASLAEGPEGYYLLGYTDANHVKSKLFSFNIEGDIISGGDLEATIPDSNLDLDLTAGKLVVLESGVIAVAGTSLDVENKNIFLALLEQETMDQELIYFGQTGNQSANSLAATSDGGMIIVGSNQVETNSVIALVKTGPDGKL